MSISSYFDTLGKDIANGFTSLGQATSLNDFIQRATTANTQLLTDIVGGNESKPTSQSADPIIANPIAVISHGIANAVDAATDGINSLVPTNSAAATPLHQVTEAIDIIAHDAANAAVAISNSGSIEKIATTAIDNSVATITDLVTHFDTSANTAAISHAVNSVVDNVTNIVDAGFTTPAGAVHAAVQVLDSVAGITSAITDAVVATNDPASLDQQAIAGVHGFSDFVHSIDQLPTTIGAGISTVADQLNGLIHTNTAQTPVLGQIGDGLSIVAHDIGVGLSSVLDTTNIAHIVTGSLDITSQTISDLVAHFDKNPAAADIAHTVNGVVNDTTDIVNTIYDAVSGGDVLGAANTANAFLGSLNHIGQTIGEQIAHTYVPSNTLLSLPVEQPVIL